MTDMVMPRLSDTMEEGTILHWLKRDGEQIMRGEELVEIETDKANMTYESDQDGVLQIVAREGDTLAVGETIARIGEEGAERASAERVSDAASSVDRMNAPDGVPNEQPRITPTAPAIAEAISPTPVNDGGRVKASPVARRLASGSGVDLRALRGSGPGGRIVKADVEAATGASMPAPTPTPTAVAPPTPTSTPTSAAVATPTPTPTPTPSASGGDPAIAAPTAERVASAKGEASTQELSRTQRTIARRMAESKATIPDFTLNVDVDMEECVALRTQLKALAETGAPPQAAPTYNDMVVKASALALREFARANGSYRDGAFELHSRVNVGVAVASEDALVVPTVFDADTKSLGEIARETRALAERVREQTITPPELGGGTFTVSNLGMFGVRSFTAIVNPPQAAILSVGALEPRAVVRAGEVVARHTMSMTLACDHRILYGADAARFIARICELLEQPASLTL